VTFDAFIETAWNDHADHPQEVAERLAGSLHLIETSAQVTAFARLTTHVYGEHLGEWDRGSALLASLRDLPAFDASAAGGVTSGIAALRFAGGDRSALDALDLADQVSALATAASAFAGRMDFRQAIAAYVDALRRAEAGIPSGSPACRALAIGGNNLAVALEGKRDRDDNEMRGMIAAAEGGLKYWRLAGTWLEEERAHYRLAHSLLAANRPHDAVASAQRCLDVCERNDAPPFERFFAHAVLALAQRAAGDARGFASSHEEARRQYERVPVGERPWCESEMKALGD
jgi:hypothetical protein